MKAENVPLASELTKKREMIIKKIANVERPNSSLRVECGGDYVVYDAHDLVVKSTKAKSIIKAILAVEFKEMLADVERQMKEIGLEI